MTSGGVSLENSKTGSAIFNVGKLGPGDSGGGQVSLSNSGTSSGDLKLTQADVTDTPGPFGGRLSGAVKLSVLDQTNGNAIVYSGTLSGLGERALGRLAPGESRSYSFATTLPDGGTPPSQSGGNNAFRSSSMTARYRWDLAEVPGSGGGGGSSMRMNGRMSVKLALRKGIVRVYLRCSQPCRLRAIAALSRRPALKARPKSVRTRVAKKRVIISLRLSRKAVKALRARVAKRGRDYLVVKVQATDPRGNSLRMTKKRIIRGRKARR